MIPRMYHIADVRERGSLVAWRVEIRRSHSQLALLKAEVEGRDKKLSCRSSN